MSDTGRLRAGLWPRTRRVVFGGSTSEAVRSELRLNTSVDLAHVTMLAEREMLDRATAGALLREIRELRDEDFASLLDRPVPRGLYLMYEDALISRLGEEVGGALHTARSRNDMKATTTAMRLRGEVLDLLDELARLRAVLLARARAHSRTVMPVYTHFQPAMPITYGYYLLGVALALGRECDAVVHASDELRRCPLGAGSVAGSDLDIDPARTSTLLGFDSPPLHALDTIASRDTVLRTLSSLCGAAVLLSRLATDLQLWSTSEFGFLHFPDRLVGGSSAMPQKRNAFLLEHVKAGAGTVIGAWTAAASMTKSTPFTNTIEVGTEAVGTAWPALASVRDTVLLSQVLVSGAQPAPPAMSQRARSGFVTATAMANQLVLTGVPFRKAHRAVGTSVRKAIDQGADELSHVEVPGSTPAAAPRVEDSVRDHRYGGGPGAFADAFTSARDDLSRHAAWRRDWRARIKAAEAELASAVERVMGAGSAHVS
ncbi:argininosuccinate lyase [Actinoalloteichus sp. AHMU CJ021]|uniref:argininosuccinate lyase n=1 Tax=Actinoalloteichus sp. AHMU CJ021 TaxID=2072503 RepID=UPI000CA05F62|nr:argininosuccinate lyase [Actinoalloteichus sp. AHMU CJ021]